MPRTDTRTLGSITSALVKAQKEAMACLELPPDSPRMRLTLTLLVGCLDHGGAAAQLISMGVGTYGASAFALFRPTLETFTRAVMFSLPDEVSDAEVAAFLDRDELPQRVNPRSGKKSAIHASCIEEIAVNEFNRLSAHLNADELQCLVKFQRKDLHGLVHGGKVLVSLYRSGNGGSASTHRMKL